MTVPCILCLWSTRPSARTAARTGASDTRPLLLLLLLLLVLMLLLVLLSLHLSLLHLLLLKLLRVLVSHHHVVPNLRLRLSDTSILSV